MRQCKFFYQLKSTFFSETSNVGVRKFIEYFDRTYMSTTSSSQYQIGFWSCYDRVLKNIPRTINTSEAWHKSLNYQAAVKHPNLAKLVDILKTEEDLTSFTLTRVSSGIEIPTCKSDLKKEWQIRGVLKSRNIFNVDSYLEALEAIYQWKTD